MKVIGRCPYKIDFVEIDNFFGVKNFVTPFMNF